MLRPDAQLLEANRIEKLLLAIAAPTRLTMPPTTTTLPQQPPPPPPPHQRPPATSSSDSNQPLSTAQVLPVLQQLIHAFQTTTSFQQHSSFAWCEKVRTLFPTVALAIRDARKGSHTQRTDNPSVFQPLAQPTCWPIEWLFPLGQLRALITGPRYGEIVGYMGGHTNTAANKGATAPIEILHTLFHDVSDVVHHQLYTKLMTIATSSLEHERWEHHQPHPYKTKRCSSGLMVWCMEMRALQQKTKPSHAASWERAMYEQRCALWLKWSGYDLINTYIELGAHVSRARRKQYKLDVLVLVLELCQMLGLLEERKDDAKAHHTTAELAQTQLMAFHRPFLTVAMDKLMVVLALVCAPLPSVLTLVQHLPPPTTEVGKERASTPTTNSPLAVFLGAFKTDAVKIHAAPAKFSLKSSPAQQVLYTGGRTNIDKLAGIALPWDQLLVEGVLPHRAVVDWAYKRHELSSAWVYPPVEKEDQAQSKVLLAALDEAVKKYGYDKDDNQHLQPHPRVVVGQGNTGTETKE